MASVRDDLRDIREQSEALLTVATKEAGLSADLVQQVAQFQGEVRSALLESAAVTHELVRNLANKLDHLRQDLSTALAALHKGQLAQAKVIKELGDDVVAGAVFGMIGKALIARAITDAAAERRNGADLPMLSKREPHGLSKIFKESTPTGHFLDLDAFGISLNYEQASRVRIISVTAVDATPTPADRPRYCIALLLDDGTCFKSKAFGSRRKADEARQAAQRRLEAYLRELERGKSG
jgi:hypothetical protein